MPATVLNFDMEQGATFSQQLACKDANGAAINLSGFMPTGAIRQSLDDALPVASFTCAVTDAANGLLTISLTAAQTAAIQPFIFMYDVEVTNGATIYKVARGNINVIGEITT